MKSNQLLDTNLLNIFVTIAESSSLTDAAKRLGVTQSAVSQSLKHLEEVIGVTLVARRTKPVQLTYAGLALKQQADTILGDLRRLAVHVRGAADMGLLRCRLGLISSFSEVFGSSLIQDLSSTIEQLTIKSGLTPSLTSAFLNREIDLLVSDSALTEIEGLERYPLFRDPMLLAVPEPFLSSSPFSLEQLANQHPMIRYSRLTHIGSYTEVVMRRMHLLTHVRFETDDSHTLMSFVRDAHGWAILSGLCVAQAMHKTDKVKILELDRSRHARSLYLLARKDEMGRIPAQVSDTIKKLFTGGIYPQLSGIAPWMQAEMFVNDDY